MGYASLAASVSASAIVSKEPAPHAVAKAVSPSEERDSATMSSNAARSAAGSGVCACSRSIAAAAQSRATRKNPPSAQSSAL